MSRMRFACYFLAFAAGEILRAHAEPAKYQIHLTWSIPTTRADGKPLPVEQIAGYELYWSCSPAASGTVSIAGGAVSSADLAGDWIGDCTFAMAAVDTDGLKSVLSAAVPLHFKPNKPADGGFD